MKYKRKLLVLIICIASGLIASYIMSDTKYSDFINGIVGLAIGFFAGNSIEHVSKAARSKNDKNKV